MSGGATRSIITYIDRGFDHRPIAEALAEEFDARLEVDADEAARVVGMVTGAAPVGLDEVAPYPNLRAVVTCTIGTDHLDLIGLAARGIAVRNTPTYCTDEVADHALTCVLTGWRGLVPLHAAVQAGSWSYDAAGLLRRIDTSCLGIIGLGRIGRSLAAKARALGVTVLAFDPHVADSPHAELVALDDLLTRVDAVSLHAPGDPGAAPLLGAAELDRLPRHAIVVNLARPGLVDLDALLARLREGRLAGAFWDVWPEEPPTRADPRLATPRLVVTPHAAWYSAEAEAAYYAEAIAALRDELRPSRSASG